MSEHRPECIYMPEYFDPEQNIVWGGKPCICDELRACEQRIRLADDDYAYVSGQAEADGRRRGWNEALDAAREAVERASSFMQPLGPALAAIDALREEQAPPPLPPSVGVPSKPMWPLREEQK